MMKKRSATRDSNVVNVPRATKSIEPKQNKFVVTVDDAYTGADPRGDAAHNSRLSRSGIERYRPNSRHITGAKDITKAAKSIYATP